MPCVRARPRQRALIEGVPQLVWRRSMVANGPGPARNGAPIRGSPRRKASVTAGSPLSTPTTVMKPSRAGRRQNVWARSWSITGSRNAAEDRYSWFQARATPVHDERGRIVEWLGTSTDVDDLRTYQERQKVMVAELQHRTRNLLGVVRSIAGQTLRSSKTLDDFEVAFTNRLSALSRVQGVLSRADNEPITMDAVLRAELDALGAANMPERVLLCRSEGTPAQTHGGNLRAGLARTRHECPTNTGRSPPRRAAWR